MAHIDRDELEVYPFDGTFYRIENDDDAPLDEQEAVERIVYQTKCDIMEASHSRLGNFTAAAYAVHFPIEKTDDFVLPTLSTAKCMVYSQVSYTGVRAT